LWSIVLNRNYSYMINLFSILLGGVSWEVSWQFSDSHIIKLCPLGSIDKKKSPKKKRLCLLAFQCGLAKSVAHVGTELLKFWPYETTVVHSPSPPACRAIIWYSRYSGDFLAQNLNFILTSHGSLKMATYVNSQNNIAAQKILILFMKCHCMIEKLGFSVQSIIGPMLFRETVNSKHYLRLMLLPFFNQLT
jgi:hypothetical protein